MTHLGTHLFGLELASCRSLVGLGIGSRRPFEQFRGVETTKSGGLRVE